MLSLFFFLQAKGGIEIGGRLVGLEMFKRERGVFGFFFFFLWPRQYDIFLYLAEMPKYHNFLHLQVQLTSGAFHVSKFWSNERRLFAWQVKPQKLYLGTVYIARREVKDLPRFQGRPEYMASYDTCTKYIFGKIKDVYLPYLAER